MLKTAARNLDNVVSEVASSPASPITSADQALTIVFI